MLGEMYAKIDHSVPSKLPPPTTGYHIYVSPHNVGAMELVEESADEEDEEALGEYLEDEGFDDEADDAARDAFGGRD